jgi:hypothetical protein
MTERQSDVGTDVYRIAEIDRLGADVSSVDVIALASVEGFEHRPVVR